MFDIFNKILFNPLKLGNAYFTAGISIHTYIYINIYVYIYEYIYQVRMNRTLFHLRQKLRFGVSAIIRFPKLFFPDLFTI